MNQSEIIGGKVPEIITYSLRGHNSNSDEYYRTVSSFCDEVLTQAGEEAKGVVEPFLSWCEQSPGVTRRRGAEAIHEMLSLGVFWQNYSSAAVESKPVTRRLFGWLAAVRKRNKFLKEGVDRVRGGLGGLILHKKATVFETPLTLPGMDILLEWLASNGEFPEEVGRLTTWKEFLGSLDAPAARRALQEITDLAGWFKIRSLEVLGLYTENVEGFLTGKHPRYRWREDYIFTGRQRVEYHLNMLGTEILNRSLRAGFLETQKRIVIVPPCMKAKPEEECQAQMTPYGERCANCTPGCHVNQITRLGEKQGFEVFIMPDDLKTFSSEGQEPGHRQAVGVVGISCPLTNTSGGWEMMRLGVPAQGLLLDYCGCIWHWDKKGIPTDINFNQLVRVVEG